MELIIGRKGQQPFTITDPSVSGKHLKITSLENGKYQIEDLSSTNGTFVDGMRIVKKTVTADTVIQLGQNYTFKIADVISTINKAPTGPTPPPPPPTYSIAALDHIWNQYHDEIDMLDSKQRSIMLWARVSPIFTLGSGVLAGILGGNPICIVLTAIGVIVMAISIIKQMNFNYKKEKETIDKEFIQKYTCPNPECHRFLGFQNYLILSQNKQCPYCRSKWTAK